MMPRWSAKPRTGRWRRRAGNPSCCDLREGPLGALRRRSIRRWATLFSGRCRGFGFLVLDQLEDVARARIARGIIARRIAGGGVRPVGVGAGVEQYPRNRQLALLDSDDQRRFAHLVGGIDLGAETEQPFDRTFKADP